jgi:hypothetical protein
MQCEKCGNMFQRTKSPGHKRNRCKLCHNCWSKARNVVRIRCLICNKKISSNETRINFGYESNIYGANMARLGTAHDSCFLTFLKAYGMRDLRLKLLSKIPTKQNNNNK